MQELMPTNCGSGPECNRAISTAGYSLFRCHLKKRRRSAQRRFWCDTLQSCKGPLVAQSCRLLGDEANEYAPFTSR